jgi:atypical dual specificity phosphatase
MTANPVFSLRDAGLFVNGAAIFENLTLDIPDRAVTVLFAPAGSGKSRLLELLRATAAGEGVSITGNWSFGTRGETGREVIVVPQKAIESGAFNPHDLLDRLFDPHAVLLLDEPDRQVGPNDLPRLASAIREHATRSAAVVTTHNQQFARTIADHVVLLCAGRIIASTDAETFFKRPPHPLVERFLSQGNCWPASPAPELPSHFRWILPNQLAGMGYPGLLADEDTELTAIASSGISILISLTERPFPPDRLRAFGISGRHFPIRDMGTPAIGPAARLCRSIERAIADGDRAGVHCHAGLGRTGTILASYLVWTGADPDAAILRVRSLRPAYIQNERQADFVVRFKESV